MTEQDKQDRIVKLRNLKHEVWNIFEHSQDKNIQMRARVLCQDCENLEDDIIERTRAEDWGEDWIEMANRTEKGRDDR